MSSAAISERVASEPTPREPRLKASVTTHMATLPSPEPPHSSGIVRPKTPRSAISSMISMGIRESLRCQSWAWGVTRSAVKRVNWSRAISRVSSPRPELPKFPCPINSAMRARAGAELPVAMRSFTSLVWNAASASSSTPRSPGRTTSTWLMAMPPANCARYSPNAALSINSSSSPSSPAASSRSAQPSIWRSAST